MDTDMLSQVFKAAAGAGAWGLLSIYLIKHFIEDKTKTINRIEDINKASMKGIISDKDKLLEIVMSQKELMIQQKDILSRQIEMLSHNEDTLDGIKIAIDKITDIQLLHANRLEKIEDRLERLERYSSMKRPL